MITSYQWPWCSFKDTFYYPDLDAYILVDNVIHQNMLAVLRDVRHKPEFSRLTMYVYSSRSSANSYGRRLWPFAINYLAHPTYALESVDEFYTTLKGWQSEQLPTSLG